MNAKRCIRCHDVKDIGEYYTHPMMADGHLNKCKVCCCSDARANRRMRVAYYRQYDMDRFSHASRRATRAENCRRQRSRNPEKTRARAAVARAIRSGKLLKRPCEVCGTAEVDAHHDDYSRALDVRWLCRTHHLIAHGKYIQQTA
jgi:hypothetical protein